MTRQALDEVTTVLKADSDELIADARPSPAGGLLAYLDGPCTPSSNRHIQVTDLTGGHGWTIGAGLKPCDSLNGLDWSGDGQTLVTAYGACGADDNQRLAVLPALQKADDLPARLGPLDPGCQTPAVTATASGFAAIQSCGPNGGDVTYDRPASLMLYDPQLQVTGRHPIGMCVDGAELRADASGTDLLGTSYQFCIGPRAEPRQLTFMAARLGTALPFLDQDGNRLADISW